MTEKLLPCPFCGSAAHMEPWHGGAPTKQFIACPNDDCEVGPQVTGETPDEAIDRWNTRTAPPVDHVTPSGTYAHVVNQLLRSAGIQVSGDILHDCMVRAAGLDRSPSQDLAIGAAHPDALAVDRFAAAMKAKLAQKRAEGRGGWDDPEQCHIDYLHQLLQEQFHERTVIDPVDIANLAMMIHERSPSDE